MTREAYHAALNELESDVKEMADKVIRAVKDSVQALQARDLARSKQLVSEDLLINRQRFDIEGKCLLLLATQQPMAGDLRVLAAILNIITDLERIGDHAEGIARISLAIGAAELVKPLEDIPRMAEKAISMLERAMKAFLERDLATARQLGKEDDEVDALNDRVYQELIAVMIRNPQVIEGANYLVWTAHNLERIADRVTNIAERVVFMVTGKMEEMNVSTY
jgi:phosphate transport system protein